MPLQFDEIGYWSELKLEIIRNYAVEYSRILTAQGRFHHVYIDAFAGAGQHVSRRTGEIVPGSPQVALEVEPPFKQYYFIDIDADRAEALRQVFRGDTRVQVYEGDCNSILLNEVFPKVRWEDFRRGLCLLDPYGLQLQWPVIETAGKMRTVDMFLNFPVMDMNRNVLWRDPAGVERSDIMRMTAYWGDESWREAAYESVATLFGETEEKLSNREVAQAFQQRLISVAGFQHVPDPIPMRNTRGAVVYYLFFASQKQVAGDIINYLFSKYKNYGVR